MTIILALLVARCAVPPPQVRACNGASVHVTRALGGLAPAAPATDTAEKICAKSGKHARFASSKPLPNYITDDLFLCL